MPGVAPFAIATYALLGSDAATLILDLDLQVHSLFDKFGLSGRLLSRATGGAKAEVKAAKSLFDHFPARTECIQHPTDARFNVVLRQSIIHGSPVSHIQDSKQLAKSMVGQLNLRARVVVSGNDLINYPLV